MSTSNIQDQINKRELLLLNLKIILYCFAFIVLIVGGVCTYIHRDKISKIIVKASTKPEVTVELENNSSLVPKQNKKERKELIDALKNPKPTTTIRLDEAFIQTFANKLVPQTISGVKPIVEEIFIKANKDFWRSYKEIEVQKENFHRYLQVVSLVFQARLSSLDKEKADLFTERIFLEKDLRDRKEKGKQIEVDLGIITNNILRLNTKIEDLIEKKKSNCKGLKFVFRRTCVSGNNNLDMEISTGKNEVITLGNEKNRNEEHLMTISEAIETIEERIARITNNEQVLTVKYNNILTLGNNIQEIKFEDFVQGKNKRNPL